MPVHDWALNKLLSDMFEDRTIVISGTLGRTVSTAVVSQLLLLNATGPDEGIRLYIDSTTGSLPDGFAICDVINWISPEVSTWAIGAVGPAATLVLCSGAIGQRYALPGSEILLRQPDHAEGLDGAPLRPPASACRRWIEEMVRHLAERTGRGCTTIARDLRDHRRLSITDSVAYGIVDRVMAGGKYAPQCN